MAKPAVPSRAIVWEGPPAPTRGAGFILADLAALPRVACPCGSSRRAFAGDGAAPCSVHLVEIRRDAQAHYHKRLTEVYYFLEGRGHMELDGKRRAVRPGVAILIHPGTRHRAIPGRGRMRILNVVVPRFNARDEWFD